VRTYGSSSPADREGLQVAEKSSAYDVRVNKSLRQFGLWLSQKCSIVHFFKILGMSWPGDILATPQHESAQKCVVQLREST
jgi:hypothetical protein